VATTNAGIYALTLTPTLTLAGYTFLAGNAVDYTISKANLTQVTASKVYDGLTTVGHGQMTNMVGVLGQSFSATAGTATISDKNVTTAGKTITSLAGLTLTSANGGIANNYNLSSNLPAAGTQNSVDISAKSLTVSGLTAPASRTYNATLAAVVSGTPTLLASEAAGAGTSSDGKPYTGDIVSFNGTTTGTYDIKDVGATTITFGGLTSSNSNYTFSFGTQAGSINKAPLTVTAANAVKNLGDSNPALTVALTGFVGGETLATSGVTGNGLATTTATVGTDAGTAVITAAVGTLAASNYAFTQVVDGTLTIRPISALSNTEVSTLIGAQLANLSGAQVGSFSTSQLQVFSSQQLSALSPSQLAGMTTLQLLSLSPVQMAAISPAKIALMTAAELGALTDVQLQALSPIQLAAIAPANFAAFTAAQIMAMSIAQVQNLSPEQLATFSSAQIASLNAAGLAYLDARQLAAIGIFPKQDSASNSFEAPIPVMIEVVTPASPVEAAQATQTVELARTSQAESLPMLPVLTSSDVQPRTGVLAVTYLQNTEARPTSAGVAYEQTADTVSLKSTASPTASPMSDQLVVNDTLKVFMVTASNGQMVEFEGFLVNKRLVIVASSEVAKHVARAEMNLVLAAAITSLGKESRVMLANLDGVVFDLR
jgi:hypothetical protein